MNPVTLAIHVLVDAMCPLGVAPAVFGGDVVSGGADPDVLALVSLLELPDADVMALGEGVEGFLEDEVGWAAVDGEQGDGAWV